MAGTASVAEPLDLRTSVGRRDPGHVHPQVQRVGAGRTGRVGEPGRDLGGIVLR